MKLCAFSHFGASLQSEAPRVDWASARNLQEAEEESVPEPFTRQPKLDTQPSSSIHSLSSQPAAFSDKALTPTHSHRPHRRLDSDDGGGSGGVAIDDSEDVDVFMAMELARQAAAPSAFEQRLTVHKYAREMADIETESDDEDDDDDFAAPVVIEDPHVAPAPCSDEDRGDRYHFYDPHDADNPEDEADAEYLDADAVFECETERKGDDEIAVPVVIFATGMHHRPAHEDEEVNCAEATL
jgi:hypothetical protein